MRRALAVLVMYATPASADTPAITVSGYLEAHYQLHFQNPENRVTSLRGFDNRSRTFTLENVVLDVKGERGPVTARVALQVGHTPSSYYLSEPALGGSPGVNATSSELWKYVQTATVALKAPREITVEAGLFLSPIGPESMPIKENWGWSRSNLFVGLPFYHTGVVVSRPLGRGWVGKVHAYNGWNSVTDNNGTPSIAVSAEWECGEANAAVLYFGGVERPSAALEGKPWRHLIDAYWQQPLTKRVTVLAHGDAGTERTKQGRAAWLAGALAAKIVLSPKLYAALRADAFYERVPAENGIAASAIFWPTEWVASGTLTLAYQPYGNMSARLEYRHDQAASDVFFGGAVAGDGLRAPYVFDRDAQDTLTLGVVAWF